MKSLKLIFAFIFVIMAVSLKAQKTLPFETPTLPTEETQCMTTPECGFQMCITSDYSYSEAAPNEDCFLVEIYSDGLDDVFMESSDGYYSLFEADTYVNAVICFELIFDSPIPIEKEIFCGLKYDNGRSCKDGCVVIVSDGP